MTIAIVTIASVIVLYMALRPLVDWYQKAKKEMEEDDYYD